MNNILNEKIHTNDPTELYNLLEGLDEQCTGIGIMDSYRDYITTDIGTQHTPEELKSSFNVFVMKNEYGYDYTITQQEQIEHSDDYDEIYRPIVTTGTTLVDMIHMDK